jgi:hypothetical protein
MASGSAASQRLTTIPGVESITATAILGDGWRRSSIYLSSTVCCHDRTCAEVLIERRTRANGGGLSKRGHGYLRRLLVHGVARRAAGTQTCKHRRCGAHLTKMPASPGRYCPGARFRPGNRRGLAAAQPVGPGNLSSVTGSQARYLEWARSADSIEARGHRTAAKGRIHDRERRHIITKPLQERGRPYMTDVTGPRPPEKKRMRSYADAWARRPAAQGACRVGAQRLHRADAPRVSEGSCGHDS